MTSRHAVVLCAALVGWPAPAAAQFVPKISTGEFFLGLGGVTVAVLGVVATVVNTNHVAQGRRAPLLWRVMGFATGGIWVLGSAISMASVSSGDRGFRVGVMSVGVVFAGMALWTTLLPERAPPPVLVTPSVLVGPLGSVGYGLALDVAAL